MSSSSIRPPQPPKPVVSIWAMVIAVGLAVLVATYLLFVEAPPPMKITIATGDRSGAYFQFATRYAEILKKEGLTLEVKSTKGSIENLRLLREHESGVSVAIVQSGVASPEDRETLVALGSLYREPLWLFYRADAKVGSDPTIEWLAGLSRARVNIGPEGSGTRAVATQILEANGLASKVVTQGLGVADAAADLRQKKLDAAFFVASVDAGYIQELMTDDSIRLFNFKQQDAYVRTYRYLSKVTIPAGLINLEANIPDKDIALVAPTAMLVARKDIHPALVSVLLATATRVHGGGDKLSNPGEFPSPLFTDLPVSEDARHFYKSGPSGLQGALPFWVASLLDRLKIMLIPLIMVLMPLLRAAPPLVRWRTRRKIYRWYSTLRDIDKKIALGLSGAALDAEIARLADIEHQVAFVEVPLAYMEEFYHLRLHLSMLQEKLVAMRAKQQEI